MLVRIRPPAAVDRRDGADMLLRFDPLREADLLAQLLARPGAGARATTMLMDAYRDGGRFIINFDLPGWTRRRSS